MSKKMKIITIVILVIVSILIGIKFYLIQKSNKEYGDWIYNSDYLYDKAINYLKVEKENLPKDKEKEDYQTFYSYHGFGIKEKDNKKYAYMYILEESYYVKHNKLRTDSKKAMLYKFTFENDEVDNYMIPKEGEEHKISVKEIFPDDIENEALNYGTEKLKYNNSIEEHYSYLDSTVAIDVDYDENMIVVIGTYNADEETGKVSTINGKCIDGYGDIYKYQIPGSEEKNMINIDNDVISKYKGEKIGTISENDLNEIKSSLNNMEYSTSKEKNENTQLSFIKVANKQQNNNDNVVELDYINDDFINIINDTSEYRTQNTSIASQKIMKILNKYNLSI